MKEKILIANRGECACRIIKTARKTGFATVSVYSDIDINSKHTQLSDEAIPLGGTLSSESYLDINKIINACKKSGAKYVHPGWGFLSENYKFAKALEKEHIVFIGPSVEAIKYMGDKIKSKQLAKSVGVDTVPGDNSVLTNITEVRKIAKKIGFPVILKASAGGGGKGIRIVYKDSELASAFESVKNEAKNSFGDDRIFMEKFVENPRHIEIQVIGDKFGNIVCLGERECSIQRNNQKVIEESPSSFVDEKTRKKMYSQVVALCKKINYYSAGTVEFMMDKDKNFYFLEMNTRLQVEHGITELVTGLDLVELMINVAMGKKLPFTQKDIKLNGWAIEARINAEDPLRDFLPSSGRVTKYIEPERSNNIRVDSGVYEGYSVSMYYDSMIAKLLVYEKTRDEAIKTMRDSLGSFYINGISHNISFLEKIMYNERFQNGDINTSFIKQEFSDLSKKDNIYDLNFDFKIEYQEVLIGSALYMHLKNIRRYSMVNNNGQIFNRKKQDKFVVDLNGQKYLCDIVEKDNKLNIRYGSNGFSSIETNWQFGDNVFRGIVNNNNISVKIIYDNKVGDFILQFMGMEINVSVRSPKISEFEKYMIKTEKHKKPKQLKSPVTGKIVRFESNEGDKKNPGDILVVVEAMKMENSIQTEYEVTIKKINFKVGDLINKGDVIMDFEY